MSQSGISRRRPTVLAGRLQADRPDCSALQSDPDDKDQNFMEKWLCFGSMGVACLLLVVFLLDMVLGLPFGRAVAVDIVGLLASAVVLFLGFDAYRDLR